MRAASLGLLWTLGVTAWLATGGLGAEPEIGDTARFGQQLFQILTHVLLALATFFAALSVASTVVLLRVLADKAGLRRVVVRRYPLLARVVAEMA